MGCPSALLWIERCDKFQARDLLRTILDGNNGELLGEGVRRAIVWLKVSSLSVLGKLMPGKNANSVTHN
jgi:hypothetical protein